MQRRRESRARPRASPNLVTLASFAFTEVHRLARICVFRSFRVHCKCIDSNKWSKCGHIHSKLVHWRLNVSNNRIATAQKWDMWSKCGHSHSKPVRWRLNVSNNRIATAQKCSKVGPSKIIITCTVGNHHYHYSTSSGIVVVVVSNGACNDYFYLVPLLSIFVQSRSGY